MAIADTISSMYENVGEVYDTITNVDVNTGKNLFDKSTITENTYIEENGNTGSSQVTNLSDYIGVKPNTSYTLSYDYSTLLNSNQRNIIYYDENKTYISGLIYLPTNKTNTITTPNNAKYIRFSYDKNCYSIMLNEGSTSLPYEPYTDTPTYKNIENIPKVIRNSYLEIMNNGIDKIWNNWEKVEGTGETLTLNSTEKAPMKINLKGNTSQETTTGKNLMPSDAIAGNTYNGIAVTLVNGKLHFQGRASAEYFASSNITLPTHLLTTKQYYFKAISNRPSPTRFKIWGYNSSDVLKINIPQDSYFTPEEEIVKYKIVFEYMTTGTSYNFDAQFQIEEGGSFTSYEPYTNGASPNPDYPQDVEVVSGNNSIKVEGKNLLTTLNATSTNKQTTISVSNGIIHDTTSKTGNTEYADVFSFTNVISYGNYGGYVIPQGNIIELEAGTYTFSYHKISGTALTYDDASKSRNINVYKYGSSTPYTNLGGARIIGDNASVTFTLTEKSRVSLTYGYYFFGDISTDVYFTLQLEKGSTATTYEPYQSTSYPVNLGVENLFDIATNTNGKVLASDGTITDDVKFTISDYIKVLPNTKYTISWVYDSSQGSDTAMRVGYYQSDKTFISRPYNTTSPYTITTPNNCYYIRICYHIASHSQIQVELGDKANSYTPYGTTPIELCKMGDYQDSIKKSTGKNLFDEDNVISNAIIQTSTQKVTWTNEATTIWLKVQPNTQYTMSRDRGNRLIIGASNNQPVLEGTLDTIIYDGGTSEATSYTFSSGNYTYIAIYISRNTSTTPNWVMINEGSTALPYEPYGSGEWYLEKQIGKVVLDGSERWILDNPSSQGIKQFTLVKSGVFHTSGSEIHIFSNYFKGVGWHNSWLYDNVITTGSYANTSRIRVMASAFSTVNDFKTWLGTHNTILYYVLKTPTTTEITDTTLLSQLEALNGAKSYTTQTNISQENNDKPFIISASALMSLKYIFGNLETRVAELETSEPSEL